MCCAFRSQQRSPAIRILATSRSSRIRSASPSSPPPSIPQPASEVGYLIDPPERVEGTFVAVFAQEDPADALALTFLRDNGIDARVFPQVGDIVSGATGGASLFGMSGLLCVPEADAD